mmetsp:Transcript_12864/g.28403  ORF Transcript_12864/g.28403 Transcript_12864/m.28403 type:complete len:521 (-) Transcript_12864:197-1759(-)
MYFAKVISLLLFIYVAEASWNVVSDDRVRSKDVSPVLGRGYSIATGSYHSTCLIVNTLTDPTSDYDYFFEEVKTAGRFSAAFSHKMSKTDTFTALGDKVSGDFQLQVEAGASYHHIIGIMKSDRYYTSIDETQAQVLGEVSNILSRGNVIQFFQACGPNYIRSIRRSTEVGSCFTFKDYSVNIDTEFAYEIEGSAGNTGFQGGLRFDRKALEMTITIFAFGLGLVTSAAGQDSDVSLIARNMDDYKRVMDTAFRSMQDPYAGKVASVELVPWTSNAAFQNLVKVDTPLSRTSYRCRDESSCEDCGYDTNHTELYDPSLCIVSGTEDALHKDLRKFNLIANAEFIARIDALVRQQLLAVQIHMNCISELLLFPRPEYDDKKLYNRNPTLNLDMTVKILTYRLLRSDSTQVPDDSAYLNQHPSPGDKYLYMEKMTLIQRYVTYFFQPCIIKLSETKYNVKSGNMQLNHWTVVPECSKTMCTLPNTRYDVDDCVPLSSNSDFVYLNYRLENYCPPQLKSGLNF